MSNIKLYLIKFAVLKCGKIGIAEVAAESAKQAQEILQHEGKYNGYNYAMEAPELVHKTDGYTAPALISELDNPAGEKGDRGPRGLKGDTGKEGPKGDPFVYSDFTSEQLANLKGEKGDKGDKGNKGDKGDPLTWDSMDPEDKITLKEDIEENVKNDLKNGYYPSMTVGKAETVAMIFKPNGNIVISNLDGQSKEFMPATPSGVPEHYTWLKYNGVTYGTFTGADGNTYGQDGKWGVYAERGGLADLTNEDMRQVIVDSRQLATNNNAVQSCILARTNLIANANSLLISGYSFNSFLRASTKLEIANLILYSRSDAYFEPSNISQMFMGCTMLHTVLGTIGGRYLTNTNNCFIGCPALKEVRISGLKTSISFASSPDLSYESLRYMIAECASNATFTITLHSTVKAKVQTGGEWNIGIEEALAIAREKGTTIDFGE